VREKEAFQLFGGELLGNIKEGLVEAIFLWYAVKLDVIGVKVRRLWKCY